jgi:hypothetical protein
MKETKEERLGHSRYEWDMAQYCIYELQKPQTQFQWNILLAAFAVYWRNCRDFLAGKGDQESIKATNYVKRFSPTSAEELTNEINNLHAHVLHLSGKRITDAEKKIGLIDAVKLMLWLHKNMVQFSNELGEPYRASWKPPGPLPRFLNV